MNSFVSSMQSDTETAETLFTVHSGAFKPFVWPWSTSADVVEDPPEWPRAQINAMLDYQDWTHITWILREHLDRHRDPRAVDWLHDHTPMGHVPLLYFAVRNRLKLKCGEIMSTDMFAEAFKDAIFLLLRTAEDSHAVECVHGHRLPENVFQMLQTKILCWISQYPKAQWPSLAALIETLEHEEMPPRPKPAWVLACHRGTAHQLGIGMHIYFGSPSQAALQACDQTMEALDRERDKVRARFFAVSKELSWEAFFHTIVQSFE